MEKKSSFPIKKADIDALMSEAKGFLKTVTYIPTVIGLQKDKMENNAAKDVISMLSRIKSNEGSGAVSISDSIGNIRKKLTPEGLLPPIKISKILLDLQRGVSIGLLMKNTYSDTSNLTIFQQQLQKQTRLSPNDQTEYNAKQQTATAVMIYTIAVYMLKCLADSKTDNDVMQNKYVGIPEINLTMPSSGIASVLFYFQRYIDAEGFIESEEDAINFACMYFEEVRQYILQRKESLKFTEVFTDKTYKLEESDFSIDGWETEVGEKATSVEFNRTEFEEIVGNREAKHLAKRIVAAILSYCFKMKRNPYDAIAKYARVIMGYGRPGTGKSLLIAAIATELYERCKWLNYPFLFHPFPDNVVSTYQGGSADRALEWFKPQSDPTRIIYAPIDDAENNLMDRSKEGVSAGVKEIIGVFLRMTEGAYSTNYGNSLIGVYTNLPEMIDKAVLSRIQKRAPIDGAITVHDFLDQNYLWMQKHMKNLPEIVKMDSIDYVYMSDQADIASVSSLNQDPDSIITHPVLRKVYNKVIKDYKKSNPMLYAIILHEVQKECGLLTSREARNIQTNADVRMVDFDLPQECWDKEEFYFLKPYDEKVPMLKDFMKSFMKGQSFEDIMLQETLKYLNTFISINLSEEDRKIQRFVDDLVIRFKAQQRFNGIEKTLTA
jgi:DNA polymerase III delta prime subunit